MVAAQKQKSTVEANAKLRQSLLCSPVAVIRQARNLLTALYRAMTWLERFSACQPWQPTEFDPAVSGCCHPYNVSSRGPSAPGCRLRRLPIVKRKLFFSFTNLAAMSMKVGIHHAVCVYGQLVTPSSHGHVCGHVRMSNHI